MSVQSDLKALETQKVYAETHLADARAQLRAAHDKIRDCEAKLDEVNRRISRLKKSQQGLIISEHAILRYIERVMGIDLEALKLEICGGRDPRTIDPTAMVLMPVGDTHKLRIVDGVAVTTITDDKQER